MSIFRPSLVVDLKLRFDEALHVVRLPDPGSIDRSLQSPNLGSTSRGLEPLLTQTGDQNASFVFGRVPKTGSVELPGYRQAGTFEFTFDWRDLPIDARTVRACAVEIHLGAVSDSDFADGLSRPPLPNGRYLSQLQTRLPSGDPNPATLLMEGSVDDWDHDYSPTGAVVTIKGRDYRGMLLDTPVASDPRNTGTIISSLNTGNPIHLVVAQLLATHPLFGRFSVCINEGDWPNGVIPVPLDTTVVPRHRRGARGNRRGGRATPPGQSQEVNFWDLIVRLCYAVGAIPYFEGHELRIRPARSIFDQQRGGIDPFIDTPFRDGVRRTVNGESFAVRRLVYGRDLASLKFNRHFAGHSKPKVVRCISHDESAEVRGSTRQIVARYPPEAGTAGTAGRSARATRVAPSNAAADEEILNVPVPGVRDVERLTEIARSIFEEVGRNEMGGSAETKHLASLGGDNTDPDMLRLRPGDGVEFFVDASALASNSPAVSTVLDMQRTSFDEAAAEIQRRIGDANLARVIVATARGQILELQRFFRVASVKFGWNAKAGVDIACDFQNYFVARWDAAEQRARSGVAPAAEPPSTTPTPHRHRAHSGAAHHNTSATRVTVPAPAAAPATTAPVPPGMRRLP